MKSFPELRTIDFSVVQDEVARNSAHASKHGNEESEEGKLEKRNDVFSYNIKKVNHKTYQSDGSHG